MPQQAVFVDRVAAASGPPLRGSKQSSLLWNLLPETANDIIISIKLFKMMTVVHIYVSEKFNTNTRLYGYSIMNIRYNK